MKYTKLLGALIITLGILAMLVPVISGLSIAFIVGIFVTVAGISRLILAFQAAGTGHMLLMLAIGILTLSCGIAMLSNPLFASAVLTILLSIYFIADGVLEIAGGLSFRQLPGRGWLMLSGVISVLLGVMIFAQFPIAGAWAIGVLFGIKLIFVGTVMLMSRYLIASESR